jgi:hypothetical protein
MWLIGKTGNWEKFPTRLPWLSLTAQVLALHLRFFGRRNHGAEPESMTV